MDDYKESPTLKTSRIMKERIKEGLPVYNAGLGANPLKQSWTLIYSLIKNSDKKEYTSANGIDKLSNKIKKYYSNLNYTVENTIVLNGLKELICILFLAFNGTIFLIRPSWVSYEAQLKILKKDYVSIMTKFENNFKVEPEELEKAFATGSGPKLLVLNNPCNPTGVAYSRDELREIAIICKKYDIIVFADEIYLDLVYDRNYTISFSNYYDKTIIGCSLSKAYCCGGYRVGWCTFPKSLTEYYNRMFSLSSSIISCASYPLQLVAVKALERERDVLRHLYKQTKIFEFIGDFVYNRVNDMKLTSSKPNSAWYIFINFSNYSEELKKKDIKNCEDLSESLINDIGLIAIPGSAFGYSGYYLRYSFVDINRKFRNVEKFKLDEIITDKLLENISKGLDYLEEWLNNL